MIVCHCHRITDRDVKAAAERGVADVAELGRRCGAGTDCGGCRPNLEELLAERRFAMPQASDPRRLAVVAA